MTLCFDVTIGPHPLVGQILLLVICRSECKIKHHHKQSSYPSYLHMFIEILANMTQVMWPLGLFKLYDGGQFLLVEERTQIHYTMYLGRHQRPSASKLTNFLTQSRRYERDSNRRGL